MSDITVYGKTGCVEADPAQWAATEAISGGRNVPVVVFPDGSYQVEPADDALRDRLTRLQLIRRPSPQARIVDQA